jgi:hypothetical protein
MRCDASLLSKDPKVELIDKNRTNPENSITTAIAAVDVIVVLALIFTQPPCLGS